MPRFEGIELFAPFCKLADGGSQTDLCLARLAFQVARAGQARPHSGGAAFDLGHHRFERGAKIDRLAQRSRAQQRKDRRAPRQPLQGASQANQRALPLG
ncbi:MAG: hypothetical protein R3E03_03560 [Novosphingobium sp.]